MSLTVCASRPNDTIDEFTLSAFESEDIPDSLRPLSIKAHSKRDRVKKRSAQKKRHSKVQKCER